MATPRLCSIPDCGKPARLTLYCDKHYARFRKYGDPLYTKGGARGEPMRFYHEVVLAHKSDDCLTWPYANNGHGYGRINVGGRKLAYVHRMACEAIHGPPPSPKHDAAHSCGRGGQKCVNPKHLRWATETENMADTIQHGTRPYGEKCGSSKLTEANVLGIRAMLMTKGPREVAKIFGVERHTVANIKRGKTWGWLS